MKKVYLAGPDVFREDAIFWGNQLKIKCKKRNLEGLFPLDNEVSSGKESYNVNTVSRQIYLGNLNMIKSCDYVVANIEPFRGSAMDVGTAWEVGAAVALGKTVVLYSVDKRYYKDRVTKADIKRSSKFTQIEDFALVENLMICESAFPGIYDNIEDALDLIKSLVDYEAVESGV